MDPNKSELVQLARIFGLGNVSRFYDEETLVSILDGDDPAEPDALEGRRQRMEQHIAKYRDRLATQLPCGTGDCTTHGCPDIVVLRCWHAFKDHIL